MSTANRRGIVTMLFAMASFVTNDALVKYVSESLPAAQLIFIRGLFSIVLLLAVAQAMGLLRPGPRQTASALRHILPRPVLRCWTHWPPWPT